MNIAILDYGAGNIASVANALKKLAMPFTVTSDPNVIRASDKAIFPGQGRAGPAMKFLQEKHLIDAIKNFQKPFLGICLGQQLLADSTEEDDAECLAVVPGTVKKFPSTMKVPHMGWNTVKFVTPSSLTKGIPDESYFYFVHSYYCDIADQYVVGTTEYSVSFCSIMQKDNFYGVQFHPEKSGSAGLRVLKNFIEL